MSEMPTRLLRDTLRERADVPASSACFDGATAAAWADDTIDEKTRASVESHAADCARCQALLAATVKSAPRPAPQSRARWRGVALAWTVPAAAAAALLIWAAVPEPKRATAPALSSSTASTTAIRPAPEATRPASASVQSQADAAGAVQRGSSDNVRATRDPRSATRAPEAKPAARSSLADAMPAAVPGAVAALPPLAPDANRANARVAGAVAPPPGSPAAESAEPYTGRVPALAMKMQTPGVTIAAPNGTTAWRVAGEGRVERTSDGGITWQTQATGVIVTFTAGAAPSSEICWLVGPKGAIVRTTDGRTWERVAFSEAVDLQSIRALDEQHATITAADGRIFSTSDGGRTWTR